MTARLGRCRRRPIPTSSTTTRTLLEKLGAKLPDNAQLTEAAFLDLVKKARAADITPIAQGVGDRPYPGAYSCGEALLRKLGLEDYGKLLHGKLSFEDPRVVEVFTWVKQLVDAGAYPKNFMTLKLGESHHYFYQKPGALMFPMGSFYTGRAFVPVDKGGQAPDFPIGIMQFPAMDGGLQRMQDRCRRRELRHQCGEQAPGPGSRLSQRAGDARDGQALDRDGLSPDCGQDRPDASSAAPMPAISRS